LIPAASLAEGDGHDRAIEAFPFVAWGTAEKARAIWSQCFGYNRRARDGTGKRLSLITALQNGRRARLYGPARIVIHERASSFRPKEGQKEAVAAVMI